MKLDTKVNTPSTKDLRIFSLALFILLAGLALWQLFLERLVPTIILGSISVLVLALTLIKIDLMIHPYRVLLILSRAISLVLTPIIFGIIYYLLFTLMGLLMRLFHYDPLDKKFNKQSPTYWIVREDNLTDSTRYEKQY